MAMVVSAPPKPFVPDVCHLCGRILDDSPESAEAMNRSDFVAAASASDSSVCIHCEHFLSAKPGLLSNLDSLLAFLPGSKTSTAETGTARASLIIVDSRREVRLPHLGLVYLGRRDKEHNIHPHIDLTYDGAVAYGVSRRHARIHQNDKGTYIEDLGSTNGTFF